MQNKKIRGHLYRFSIFSVMTQNCCLLSLVPYSFLPPRSGGQLCITWLHHHLGVVCQDHLAGTTGNESDEAYAFQLHKIFPNQMLRYLPLFGLSRLSGIAKRYDVNAIICEHPYMAFTAMALSRKLKLPWYMRSHNIESERFKQLGKKWWPVLRTYERYAMRQASGTFFITPEDRDYAIAQFGLDPAKCHFIPYGTVHEQRPEAGKDLRSKLAQALNIDATKPWAYFLGDLTYKPNEDAVAYIVNEIVPLLRKNKVSCTVLIGGKGLSQQLQEAIKNSEGYIYYLGFIDDLDTFIKSCDVMINPVLSGGGIKTKLVEALGYNKVSVSTRTGAAGILKESCGDNLLIAEDHDWQGFSKQLAFALKATANIPGAFYENYYWGNIAKNVLHIIGSKR